MEYDRLILGNNKITTFNSRETSLNNMILTIGSSGSGKTERIVKPQILHTFNNNLIVSLAKTNDIKVYRQILKDRGYETYVIDFTNPKESTLGFDPFNFIKSEKDIKDMAKAIANSSGMAFNKDPYWNDVCTRIITGIIALMYERQKFDESAPKPSLVEFFSYYSELYLENNTSTSLSNTSLDEFFDRAFLYNANSLAFRSWKSIKGLASKTSSCVYSTLNNIIEDLFSDDIFAVSKIKKQLSLDIITNKKSAIFIVTSPADKSVNKYVDIFYSTIFSRLFEYCKKKPLNRSLHLIYDDFACTSKVNDFEQYVSIFRSLNISMTLVLQSITQLSSMYGPDNASIILDNCDRTIFLGNSDVQTCRIISQKCNRPLSDIVNLPLHLSVVFERGHKPSLVKKYNTYEDKYYQKYFENLEMLTNEKVCSIMETD